jgi:hypothetical protein
MMKCKKNTKLTNNYKRKNLSNERNSRNYQRKELREERKRMAAINSMPTKDWTYRKETKGT